MDVRRARRIKIGLAALAVLGVGAALTSAAWNDVVFFDADVTTGNFNLQGALPANQTTPQAPTDDAAWLESDDETAIELHFDEIQIAADDEAVGHRLRPQRPGQHVDRRPDRHHRRRDRPARRCDRRRGVHRPGRPDRPGAR